MSEESTGLSDNSREFTAEEAPQVVLSAVSRFTFSDPDPASVSLLTERLPFEWQERLLDELSAALLAGDRERTDAWIEATAAIAPRTFVASVTEHMGRFTEVEGLYHQAEAWRSSSDPFDGLNARGAAWFRSDLVPFRLLRRLNPRRWCEALDLLPGPEWFAIAGPFSINSVENALSLVVAAPIVFGQDGAWTRSVAVIVAVDAALSRIDRTLGELRASSLSYDGEFSPWSGGTAREIAALVKALLARPDGSLLGLGFIAQAARYRWSHGRGRAGTALDRFARQIGTALSPSHIPVEALGAWWRVRSGYGTKRSRRNPPVLQSHVESPVGAALVVHNGFDLLVAVANVIVKDEHDCCLQALESKRKQCWDLCAEALLVRDPGIPDAFENTGGENWDPWWIALAELLALQGQPPTCFESVRDGLAPQVERLAHWYNVDDVWIERPAAFAVMLALMTASIGAAQGRAWAASMHAVALSLAATLDVAGRSRHMQELRKVLIAAIGTAPRCGVLADVRTLRGLLEHVVNVPWDLLSSASLLRRNGAGVEALGETFMELGVDVHAALRAAEDAEALGFLEAGRLSIIRSISAELGAPLTRPIETRDERTVAETRHARLIAVGPLPRLANEFGIDQPVGVLRTVGPTTPADVRWARDILREHADRIDAEILITSPVPGHASLQGSVTCPVHASDDEIDTAVASALLQQDPYVRREVVVGCQRFGRTDVIREIGEALSQQRIVGLFGIRRIGKTTTVRAVVEEVGRAADVIWVDLQGIVRRDLGSVVAALRRAISERLGVPRLLEHDEQRDPGDELEEALSALRRRRREETVPACLVFDEFDLLFEGVDGGAGVERAERLLEPLVAAADARVLSILAIGRDPRRFRGARGRELAANPLVGRMHTVWLGGLSVGESDTMLMRLGRRGGLDVGEAVIRQARALAGGHPLLLRLAGRALREVARRHGLRAFSDDLWGEARERFLEDEEVQQLVADTLHTLARRFPDAWRVTGPAMLDGYEPDLHALDSRTARILRWLFLIEDSDVLPEVYRRLAPYVGVPREAA